MTSSLPHENTSTESTSVKPVETQPLYPGASSQRESSLMYTQANANNQNNLNKSHGGYKKKKKHRGGSSGTMVVPSFDPPGQPVSGTNQQPTAQSVAGNTTSTQGAANAKYDVCATDPSNSVCTTGGRKKRTRKMRKSRKIKKSKKSRKSKKKKRGGGLFNSLRCSQYKNYIKALEKKLDNQNISYSDLKKKHLHYDLY